MGSFRIKQLQDMITPDYKEADVMILMYDISNKNSFDKLEEEHKEIKERASDNVNC